MRAIKKLSVMRASELQKLSVSRTQLRRLVDGGQLILLGAGFYAHPSLDPFIASIIAVARFYPHAVVSGISALVIHDLTDERIDKIDVDIERGTSIRNKLLRTRRVKESRLFGIATITMHGHKVRVYDRERSLCDAYMLDPDGALFIKALKRYVHQGKIRPEKLVRYDGTLGTHVLRAVKQEIADG